MRSWGESWERELSWSEEEKDNVVRAGVVSLPSFLSGVCFARWRVGAVTGRRPRALGRWKNSKPEGTFVLISLAPRSQTDLFSLSFILSQPFPSSFPPQPVHPPLLPSTKSTTLPLSPIFKPPSVTPSPTRSARIDGSPKDSSPSSLEGIPRRTPTTFHQSPSTGSWDRIS